MNRHLVSFLILSTFVLLAAGSTKSKRSSASESDRPSSAAAPERPVDEDVRVTAAALFTSRYSRSGLSHVSARAAGFDCGVLLVTVGASANEELINAVHFDSSVYEGGVAHFYQERSFRGVVYRDASGKLWKYGLVGEGEIAALTPC